MIRMIKRSLIICGILFYSSVFAQDQYFLDETEIRLPFTNKNCVVVDGADIDGDGDIDILASVDMFTPPFINCYLFVNNGNGYFSQENATRLPDTSISYYDVGFGDVDADNDFDMYLVSEHYQDILYINDGYGFFSDETFRLPQHNSENGHFVFGDFSGDMFWDIISICVFDNGQNHYLLNDGFGFFEDVTSLRMPIDTTFDMYGLAIDHDNDLDLDLLATWMLNSAYLHIRGLVNDNGYFRDFEPTQMNDRRARWADAADLDNDGDLDVVISSIIDLGIFMNYDGILLEDAEPRLPVLGPGNGSPRMFGLGDYDNDGDIDIFAGYANDVVDHLYINDGNAYFSLADNRVPNTTSSTAWVEPFDADNDGDLDLFLGCTGDGQQRIFINYSTPDTIPPSILAIDFPRGILDSLPEYWFKISAFDNITVEKGMLEVGLVYRFNGGIFDTLSFRHCGGTLFKKTISGIPTGTFVQYYVFIRDRMDNITYSPTEAPDSLFNFFVNSQTNINLEEQTPKGEFFKIYPNPSNSAFTIAFYVPSDEKLELSIYNIMGNKIYTRSFDYLQPSGFHKWNWEGWSGLPSGIYYIVFKSILRKEVKKAVLIK